MGYLEKTIRYNGTDSKASTYNGSNVYIHYNGNTMYIYPNNKNMYSYLPAMKLFCIELSTMLNNVGIENTIETTTDSVGSDFAGTYDATINFVNKNYKIKFYTYSSIITTYDKTYWYNYIILYDLTSNTIRQINISDMGLNIASNKYGYFHIRLYYNDDNIYVQIFNNNVDCPQYQNGWSFYIGQKITTTNQIEVYPCFGSTGISYGIQDSITSVVSKSGTSIIDESATYTLKNDLFPLSDMYSSKVMKSYTQDLCWFIKNAHILSNDIKGNVVDKNGNKYICFGKFMFQYDIGT